MSAGLNRFTWDLNSTGVVTFPGMILWGATQNGPAVLPGNYQVRLTADGVTQTQPFTVLKHPLRPISDADLQFQWDLASRIRDKVNEANLAVIQIRRIKTDIADRIKDAPAEVRSAGEQLAKALSAVEEDVYQVKNQSGQDPLNFPIKTNNRLASLLSCLSNRVLYRPRRLGLDKPPGLGPRRLRRGLGGRGRTGRRVEDL